MAVPTPPSRRRLLTGPAGSGKTHRALERVREAATTLGPHGRGARRGHEVLLVLPTYAQAMHVERTALSRWEARAVLDEPFATFTSAGERFLDGFRVRTLPSREERDALMARALALGAEAAFAAVADRPGFRDRLLRLVKEVKQSGCPPEEARARLAAASVRLDDEARDRLSAFTAVFARYDRLLEEAGLEDHEDTLRRLRETLDEQAPTRPPRLLVVDGFDDFTPVEQQILDALTEAVVGAGGEVLVTLPWEERRAHLFAASAPARAHLVARGFVEERLGGFPRAPGGTLAAIAADLFLPWEEEGEARGPDEAVRMVVAGDPEDEAEAVAREARRLMRNGHLRGWRDVGVIVRRLDEAGRRIAAALERLGVPCRLVGAGRPLAAAGVVRALRGPLGVLGGAVAVGRFDAAAMVPWLRWCAAAASDDALAERVDRLELRWRRHGFPPAWDDFRGEAARARIEVGELEAWRLKLAEARGAERVFAALAQALAALAPLPPAGGIDETGRPIDPAADERRRGASAAHARLLAILADLDRAAQRGGSAAAVDAAAATRMLGEALVHARVAVPDRRLDAVNLLDAEEARFWELPVVFVAGLAQGLFPLHPREDVLLRDAERERLLAQDGDLALPLARDREVRERRLFYGALTRARRRLVLFRAGCDREGDAESASSFLRDLARVVRLDEATARRGPGRPAPARGECFTVRDWDLFAAAALRAPGRPQGDARLAQAILATGDASRLARAARWRRPEADPLADARLADRFRDAVALTSASSLNAALLCRHRFFLRSVVRVPEDDVPLDGPVFAERDEGVLLHEALRLALRDPALSPEAVVEAAFTWAEGEGRAGVPRPAPFEHDRLREEVLRVVRLMRRREEDLGSPLRPLLDGLERAFGEDGEVVLGDGDGRFALRGKIDRIDRQGDRAVVIDYKRSPGGVDTASKALEEGWDVQLPLYAAAVEAILALQVVGFEWVAATAKARRGRWNEAAADLHAGRREAAPLATLPAEAYRRLVEEAVARAGRVVARIRKGDHAKQQEDPAHCGRCGWRVVCRPLVLGGRGRGRAS